MVGRDKTFNLEYSKAVSESANLGHHARTGILCQGNR